MGFTCDHDGGNSFYSQSYPKARKLYHCHECHEVINKGDLYARAFAVYEGSPGTHIACERCGDLISSFEGLGFCWYWGSFLGDYQDWLEASGIEYPNWLRQVRNLRKWKETEPCI